MDYYELNGFPNGIRGPLFDQAGMGPYRNRVLVQPAEIYDPTGQSRDFPTHPTGRPNMAYFTKLIDTRRNKNALGAYEDFLPYGMAWDGPDFIFRHGLGGFGDIEAPRKTAKWLGIIAGGALTYYLLKNK